MRLTLYRTDSIDTIRTGERQPQGKENTMKTLRQVLDEYRQRGEKALYKAMVAVRDEVDAGIVDTARQTIERKKVTLKELRHAVDILECYAERGKGE